MIRPNTEEKSYGAIDQFPGDDAASLVAARLRRSPYPLLRDVKCESRDGITVLSGTVPSFHLKQLAQALALHTPGVREIENRLHVTHLVL